MSARRSWIWATSSLGSVVTKANVSRYVPSGRFHASQMPAKGERAGLGQSDVEDALDGLGRFCFPRRFRRRTKEISRHSERFRAVGRSTGFFFAISVRDSTPWLRPFVKPTRGNQAAALGEGLAPHFAVGQPVRFGINGRELLEFELTFGEPRHNAPAHHYQFALSGFPAAANDRLEITRRDVVVRRDEADVVRRAAHIEVLGNLLLIEEA